MANGLSLQSPLRRRPRGRPGQVLYLARMLRPDAPWLTIAPGASRQHAAGYLRAN